MDIKSHAIDSGAAFYGNFLPIILAALAFTGLIAFLRNRISNISLYAISSLFFFAVYFTSHFTAKGKLTIRPRQYTYAELFSILLIGGYLIMNFFRESRKDQGADFNESLFRYQIPHWAYFLLLGATTAASFFLIQACRKQKRHPLPRLLISIPYVVLLSCTVCVPNIFYSHFTFFHAHAYYSSLYDVLNLAPLGELCKPYYGHYGLFFLLPCKLIQLTGVSSNIAVAIFIATCNVVLLFTTLYVVDSYTKNDALFFIMLLSLGNPYLMMVQKLFFIKDVYLQMIPHRVLFPALISAFMVAFSNKKLGRGHIIVLYILAALSLVWSPEIGLICIASIALFVLLRVFDFSSLRSRNNLKAIGFCCILFLLAVFSAYLIVLVYDVLTSGQGISFAGFMYPLSGEFGSIAVTTPMPDLLRTWYPVVIFFLTSAVLCPLLILKQPENRNKTIASFCITVLALGILLYFINNPIQLNLMIVFFQFIMIFTSLLDSLTARKTRFRTKIAFPLLALLVSSTFVLGNAGMKEVLTDRRTTAWQIKSLAQFAAELDKDIPEGTPAFGWGVSDLFATINRDPGIHVLDWVNIQYDRNPIYLAHVNSILEGTDCFFAYEESADLLPARNSFVIAKEYEYKGWKYALYRRN